MKKTLMIIAVLATSCRPEEDYCDSFVGKLTCEQVDPQCEDLACELNAARDLITRRYHAPDLAMEEGFALSHGWRSFQGMGVTLAKAQVGEEGIETNLPARMDEPNLLFYLPLGEPNPDGPNPGTFTDQIRDDEYRLVAWGYAATFDAGAVPSLGRLPAEAWFVHEAGWHLANGEFQLTPPDDPDDNPTQPPVGPEMRNGALPPVWHRRIWDLHAFVSTTGEVRLEILNPFEEVPGDPGPANAFFRR